MNSIAYLFYEITCPLPHGINFSCAPRVSSFSCITRQANIGAGITTLEAEVRNIRARLSTLKHLRGASLKGALLDPFDANCELTLTVDDPSDYPQV